MAKPATKNFIKYEVEMGECGHAAPIDFMVYDDDGHGTCPNCMNEYLNHLLKGKRSMIRTLKKKIKSHHKFPMAC